MLCMDRLAPRGAIRAEAKPHRGPGTKPQGHGADHRGPGPPEILGRHTRPRARRLPPPDEGQGRPGGAAPLTPGAEGPRQRVSDILLVRKLLISDICMNALRGAIHSC